ncbi:TolC family protein [Lentisphaerota bacterium WC36G]|nr:TolC family protein [Lentisphaerae bacterium WC36]
MKRFYLVLFSGVLVAALSGCYSATKPPAPYEEEFYNDLQDEEKVTIEVKEGEFLSLKRAQEVAVANNPNFTSIQHAMNAAWARYYQSLAAYLPTISGDYSFNQAHNNPGRSNSISVFSNGNIGHQINLRGRWLAFNGFIRTFNALAAKHQAQSSEELTDDTRRLLLRSVAFAYNAVLLAIENFRIADENLKFQERLLKESQIKYDLESVPLSDVLNFKIQVNNANSAKVTAKFNYEIARFALGELMGLTDATLPESTKFPKIQVLRERNFGDVNSYIDTALFNRPDLKRYRQLMEVAKYNMYAAWGSFAPVANIEGEVGYQNNTSRTANQPGNNRAFYDQVNAAWGVTVNWVLFEGGSRVMDVRATQALLSQAEYNVATQWLLVVQEVRSAFENVKQNATQVDIFAETLKLVKQQRDLVDEEFRAGNTTIARLNEAQTTLVNAQSQLAIALVNLQNAHAELKASTNSNPTGAEFKVKQELFEYFSDESQMTQMAAEIDNKNSAVKVSPPEPKKDEK